MLARSRVLVSFVSGTGSPLKEYAYGDVDAIISQDESSVAAGELGGRHCDLYRTWICLAESREVEDARKETRKFLGKPQARNLVVCGRKATLAILSAREQSYRTSLVTTRLRYRPMASCLPFDLLSVPNLKGISEMCREINVPLGMGLGELHYL